MSNGNLPIDIIIDILSRLPVKTLTQFKCVSKPWRSLISSPNFIKSHLNRTSIDPKNDSLIVHSVSDDYDDVITIFRIGCIETPLTPNTRFPEPFFKMELVGSVNGLVCLCDCSLGFMIVLWNPATSKCKSIPFPRRERGADKVFVGFGFDSAGNEFKIICIFQFKNQKSRFYVYLCNSGSWKDIHPEFPFTVPHMWSVVTVKGVPYWMGYTVEEGDESKIREVCISFDAENEVFGFFPLPEYETNSQTGGCLVNVKGSLADIIFSPGVEVNKMVDVYILDETLGSWSKTHTLGPLPVEVRRILHCFMNGEIVIEDHEGKLLLYDPNSKGLRDLRIDKARELSYKAFTYIESLVSIDEMCRVLDDDRQKKYQVQEDRHEMNHVQADRHRMNQVREDRHKINHVQEEDLQESTSSIRKRDDFLSEGFKLKL